MWTFGSSTSTVTSITRVVLFVTHLLPSTTSISRLTETVTIENVHYSGSCVTLDPSNNDVIAAPCHPGSLQQQWDITPSPSTVSIGAPHTSLCLQSHGDFVITATCDSHNNDQHWQKTPSDPPLNGFWYLNTDPTNTFVLAMMDGALIMENTVYFSNPAYFSWKITKVE